MFRGVNHISMDAKGRMALPARQREKLLSDCAGQLVATIDTQSPCLWIYPLPTWETLEREIQDLPTLDPAVRRFQRLIVGYASDLELDGSGRILLPQSLREYASLEKKVVLVGQVKRMELWDEEAWLAERAKLLEEPLDSAAMPEGLMALSL